MEAFDELTIAINKLPNNKKVVLFFDELPWHQPHSLRYSIM